MRIVGAWFPEAVDLADGRLDRQLWLDKCRFGGEVDLTAVRISGWLSLEGSAVAEQSAEPAPVSLYGAEIDGSINMNTIMFRDVELADARVTGQLVMHDAEVKGVLRMRGLEVGQHLLMRGGTVQNVDLAIARIGTQVDMSGITVNGVLDMRGLEVGDLFMDGGTFQDVDLASARITGQLNLDGAKSRGLLNMDALRVGQHLLMGDRAIFRDVELTNAQVAGQLSVSGAVVTGQLDMGGLEVEQTLFMRKARFEKQFDLVYAHIGSNLQLSGADFSGAEFTELDLSATRIEGELDLGSGAAPALRWREGARLTLRDTHAGALRDRPDAWEGLELQLDGFTYGRLGGFGGVAADVPARGIGWYIAWLARDPSYTPQPYEQLAAVFREAGEPAKANRILYENRERARAEAWEQHDYARWLGLSLLKWTIGYGLGLRYFLALLWVIAFTTIGTAILYCSGQPSQGLAAGLPAKVVYSLDQLLPIVEFEKYENVELKGGVAYYFYVHKLIGWLLGSFLVAGLAGLTQK